MAAVVAPGAVAAPPVVAPAALPAVVCRLLLVDDVAELDVDDVAERNADVSKLTAELDVGDGTELVVDDVAELDADNVAELAGAATLAIGNVSPSDGVSVYCAAMSYSSPDKLE